MEEKKGLKTIEDKQTEGISGGSGVIELPEDVGWRKKKSSQEQSDNNSENTN